MHVLLVLLIMIVALGRGGYDPWATLVLELGAAGFALWLVLDVLNKTGPEERRKLLEQRSAWSRLPFLKRYPWFRIGSGRRTEVTILPPGSVENDASPRLDPQNHFLVLGFPVKRTGLGLPILLLSLWIALSLVPINTAWLESISPEAYSLRAEAETLANVESSVGSAPWSLAPFLTLRDLWQWLAYLVLFYSAFRLAENAERVKKLTLALFLCGIAFGAYGTFQWLAGLQSQGGGALSIAILRARGTFGNPNHYAAFLGMILLCSLGWLASRNGELSRTEGRRTRQADAQEARARLILGGLGIVVIGLGIVFSLSRSGITFALAGCVALTLLTKRGAEPNPSETIELESRHRPKRVSRSSRGYWALGLAVAGFAVWIGIEPVISRFGDLPEHWVAEKSRPQVWKDSLGAVEDFWLTGSGLSSNRYITSNYRTFSGPVFYSWAHNDYLQFLIELGLPGFLLFVWISVVLLHWAHRAREELASDPALFRLHAGFCAALVAIALHSFTDFSLHLPANFSLLSLIVGIVMGLQPPKAGAEVQPQASASVETR